MFADKIYTKVEIQGSLQHFTFLIVLDGGGWRNTGKEVTGIFGPTIATENLSVVAFHQILHSKVSVLIVTGKHGVQEPTDAQLLRRFGRLVASTVTTPGMAREPHHSQGLGGFIQLLWLNVTREGGK